MSRWWLALALTLLTHSVYAAPAPDDADARDDASSARRRSLRPKTRPRPGCPSRHADLGDKRYAQAVTASDMERLKDTLDVGGFSICGTPRPSHRTPPGLGKAYHLTT